MNPETVLALAHLDRVIRQHETATPGRSIALGYVAIIEDTLILSAHTHAAA